MRGKCPSCGHNEFDIKRCGECALDDLTFARANTGAGRTMGRVLEMDFIADRFRVGWDEVSVEDVRGLQVLKQERDRWEKEKRDRMDRENRAGRRK